jgi:dCMP deaminase
MNINRPDWDTYFMSMAFLVAQRSPDAQTKHGAIIVDKNHRVIGMGYNGFVRGVNDEEMPNTRPDKYHVMCHADTNAILNASRSDLSGCTIYITGKPCNNCLKLILQSGIRKIICGHVSSACIDKDQETWNNILLGQTNCDLYSIGSYGPILQLLDNTQRYIRERC